MIKSEEEVKTTEGTEPRIEYKRITDWPEDDRPREKLLNHGAGYLSDSELVAILIRTGTRKATAVDIGKQLIINFGSLLNISHRSVQELIDAKIPGLKKAKSISLVAAFEIGRRNTKKISNEKKLSVHSPEVIAEMFIPKMQDMKQEKFYIVMLDSANHFIRDVQITKGTLNSSLAHPREVFRPAIAEPAASIILLHNHPSGNPEPSSEDMQITKQLVEAGKIIGIPVHDHIIIAGHTFTSFAERGLI
ncbi:MAG: DNA repair protein RadC [Ignavibacteriales bacterium]|nr:DNA repair protein RadC [Ignavibacteriales bacterium]